MIDGMYLKLIYNAGKYKTFKLMFGLCKTLIEAL